jgi:hypothetical protein
MANYYYDTGGFPSNPNTGDYLDIRGVTYKFSTKGTWDIDNVASTYTAVRQSFTAVNAQTLFPITDGFDSGFVDVFMDGIKLHSSDFIDSSGTSIVLIEGASEGQLIDVIAHNIITIFAPTGATSTTATTDPLITSNLAVGHFWINSTSGEAFVCTDATTDANVWTNIGDGTQDIQPNDPPTDPTNITIADQSGETSFDHIFTGGTDTDGTVTHYIVDQLHALLTVTNTEVAAGSAHTFTIGTLSGNQQLSFRVRSKDDTGSYSSGVTVTFVALLAGTISGGSAASTGNITHHTFTSSSTFTVSGAVVDVDILVVAGGGSGGSGGWGGGGGGGAGGMYYRQGMTLNVGTYAVVIGAGGASVNAPWIVGITGNNTTFGSLITVDGGGYGGSRTSTIAKGTGGNGGSGGGAGRKATSTDVDCYGGSATTTGVYEFGTAGGQTGAGGVSWDAAGGGGASSGQGGGGMGGAGKTINIRGTSETFAGGGGGDGGSVPGTTNLGGPGGGGNGTWSGNASGVGLGLIAGHVNTGGGGGGVSWDGSVQAGVNGGGSGIVIVRLSS